MNLFDLKHMKDEKVEREALAELHELDAALTEIKDKLRGAEGESNG